MSSMELNWSIGIEVSEYEFKSSYNCSRIAWTWCEVLSEDRNPDSSCCQVKAAYKDEKGLVLTSHDFNTLLTFLTIGS